MTKPPPRPVLRPEHMKWAWQRAAQMLRFYANGDDSTYEQIIKNHSSDFEHEELLKGMTRVAYMLLGQLATLSTVDRDKIMESMVDFIETDGRRGAIWDENRPEYVEPPDPFMLDG